MNDEQTTPSAAAATAPSSGAVQPWLTSRRTLVLAAVVLSIVLLALILFLLMSLVPDGGAQVDAEPVAGIQAEVVITGPGEGANTRFDRPLSGAWSRDGERIYVADSNNDRICVFDADGDFVSEFGGTGIAKPVPGATATWDQGELNFPVDVAVDDEGRVYVADFANDSISVFSADGEFVRRFPDPQLPTGKGGSGLGGRGIAVTAVAVQGDLVYATDAYQVLVFTRDGELVRQFGKPGSAPGDLDRPNGIAASPDGSVYVSDSNNNRVAAYTGEGELLWTVGSKLPATTAPSEAGQLVMPRGITIMGDGALLVADPIGQQLVEISAEGQIRAVYGARGGSPGALNFPNDVDWRDQRIVVADKENNRVQVVRLTDE